MDVSARPSDTTSAEDWLCQCRSSSKVKGRMHDILAVSQRRFREMITLADFGDESILKINAMASNLDGGEGWIRSMVDTIREGMGMEVVPSVDYFDAAVLNEDHDLKRMLKEAAELRRGTADRSASAVQEDITRTLKKIAAASAERRGARRQRPYPSMLIKNEPGASAIKKGV